MTIGRPSGYKAKYCDEAVEFLSQGYSVAALAGHLKVSKQTVYNWMDENQNFFDAVKRGQAGAVYWWENVLRDNAVKAEGNSTATIFGLKNRAPEEWRDVNRTEHTGADGGAIKTEEVSAADKLKAMLDAKSSGPTSPASEG